MADHDCTAESSILACGSQKTRYGGPELAALLAEEFPDLAPGVDVRECLVCGLHFCQPCALVERFAHVG